MDSDIKQKEETSGKKTNKHNILKGKALAAKLAAARQEGIFVSKKDREGYLAQAEAENADALKKLCSLFDESLAFSTKVASSLEKNQRNPSDTSEDELDLSLFSGGTLRDYQREGTAWMMRLRKQGLNGILADEMGLGKTAQSIAMICHLVSSGVSGPFLILGPLSTVKNWENEFKRFSPSLPVVLFHGNRSVRKNLVQRIRIRHKLKDGSSKTVFPVVIVPYHTVVSDIRFLERMKWSYLVFDEASVIKNSETAIYKCASSLYVTGKLLLTGTPLQNNIRELFNLLHFTVPKIFQDFLLFEGWLEELDAHREEGSFGDGDSCQLVSTMHSILAPFFLRRTKDSVNIELPSKKHIIVYCPLTKLQEAYYRAILAEKQEEAEDSSAVEKNGEPQRMRTRRRTILANEALSQGKRRRLEAESMTPAKRTRRLSSMDSECSEISEPGSSNDSFRMTIPKRIPEENGRGKHGDEDDNDDDDGPEDDFYGDFAAAKNGRINFDFTVTNNIVMALRKLVAHPWLVQFDKSWGSFFPRDREAILKRSGKLQVFDILLRELLRRNHKVLVFSNFTTILDLVSWYLDLSGLEHFYLSGMNKLQERQDNIDAFNKPDSVEKVFLLSTRAGGMGINLTGADTVIFFDSDWNPQMDLQAADRCHRLGQTQKVVIYRLVGKGTIDERILDVATKKRRLEKLVMKCGQFDKIRTLRDLSKGDLLEVLRGVDWDAALDGDLLDPSRLVALADRDLVFQNADHTIEL